MDRRLDVGEFAPVPDGAGTESHERHRRTYHTLVAIAVVLAVVGSPLLMRGFAAFVGAVSSGRFESSAQTLRGVGLLVISASPLAISGLAWRRACALEHLIEQENLRR